MEEVSIALLKVKSIFEFLAVLVAPLAGLTTVMDGGFTVVKEKF
jgi:hypothetical protein